MHITEGKLVYVGPLLSDQVIEVVHRLWLHAACLPVLHCHQTSLQLHPSITGQIMQHLSQSLPQGIWCAHQIFGSWQPKSRQLSRDGSKAMRRNFWLHMLSATLPMRLCYS